MSDHSEVPLLERQLLSRLDEIERQIVDLTAERTALQRLITKARRENLTARDVIRKNSFDRVLVENRILELLGEAGSAYRTDHLFHVAKSVRFDLKGATFRSHLNRLKRRGLISHAGHGYWVATKGDKSKQ